MEDIFFDSKFKNNKAQVISSLEQFSDSHAFFASSTNSLHALSGSFLSQNGFTISTTFSIITCEFVINSQSPSEAIIINLSDSFKSLLVISN